MTAVDSLSAAQPTAAPARSAFSAMSSEDFTKLIFSELSKQDPLQPNDTNALLQQIGQIRSIQSNVDLTASLKTLVSQSEFASASALLGKKVSGVASTNVRAEGVVRSVSRTSDGAVVELATGDKINFSKLDTILTATGGTP